MPFFFKFIHKPILYINVLFKFLGVTGTPQDDVLARISGTTENVVQMPNYSDGVPEKQIINLTCGFTIVGRPKRPNLP